MSLHPKVLFEKISARVDPVYVIFVVLLILSGVVYFSTAQTHPVIEDSLGYIHAGQRLAGGQGPTYEDINNQIAGPYFSMYAFQIRRAEDRSRTFLGFPPGFPLLLAGAIKVTNHSSAVYYVVPLWAFFGLLTTFLLGKVVGVNAWTGLWAAAILAISPTYLEFGTAPWSEVPSLALISLGFCCYLCTRRNLRYARRNGFLLSALGGLSIAYSFFIRYTNVIVLLPLVVYELYTGRKEVFTAWRRWIFFFPLGLSLLGIPIFNYFYYGGLFLTSYSPAHGWYPWAPFSLAYALGPSFVNGFSLIEIGKTLWFNFSWLLLAVPVGWFFLKSASVLLLGTATLSFVLLYTFYAFAPVGVNMRFLLPIFPLLALSIGETIGNVGKKICRSKRQRWILGGVLMLILYWPALDRVEHLQNRNASSRAMVENVRSMVALTPEDAVFLSYVYNDQIAFYGQRSVLNYRRIPPSDAEALRYQMEVFEPCLVGTVDSLLETGRFVYYVEDKSPSFWDSLAILEEYFALDLIRTDPNIYRILTPDELEGREGLLTCPQ